MKRYNPKEIEPRWQKKWADDKVYEASEDTGKPKKYVLEYFPYPSGAAMHVGHVRNYTIGDAISRHARMRGYNVLHPMGWDAFGLPAENYAIKTGISPAQAITENTGRFKQQLTQMGFGYDWSREFASSDPEYYRWTQWFFLLLFKRGLAYRKESLQWWCPVDKTVLANEQVENGRCWRCGSEVEKKSLKQWFFKITDYADRLARDLDDVNWTDSIKAMQRNWIGRSKGAEVAFAIDGADQKLTIFTTRPDTLYGATFMVLAPEHPLVEQITAAAHKQQVENYQQKARNKSDIERQETNREKTGVFTGAYGVNPVNGEKIPIWIADFVLAGYGTGAIFADACDERDFEFAKKHQIPLKPTVVPENRDEAQKVMNLEYAYTAEGLLVNSGPFTGMHTSDAREKIMADLAQKGQGKERINYKMRDWLISRQRYWGAPIPIVHCAHCANEQITPKLSLNFYKPEIWQAIENGTKTVESRALNPEEKDRLFSDVKIGDALQLVDKNSGKTAIYEVVEVRVYKTLRALYDDAEFAARVQVTGKRGSWEEFEESYATLAEGYLEKIKQKGIVAWAIRPMTVPVAVPEDQLPVKLPEVKSFAPSGDGRSPLALVPEFVNTTCPKCGGAAERETDTMDGFACSSWYFLRFADPHNTERAFDPEKVKQWLPVDDYIGGAEHAVMHLLYARMWTKVMQDEGLIDFSEPFKTLRNHGMILAPDGQKMSKSKGNVIAPDELIDQGYGADAIRIMELFIGPWNQAAAWSVEGMGGAFRFLQRIWTLTQSSLERAEAAEPRDDTELKRIVHRAIHKVSQDLEDLGFNTAIAALMESVNDLYKIQKDLPFEHAPETWKWALETLLQLLAPFAPHITEELWAQTGHETSIHRSEWPAFDEQYLVSEMMTIVVQVNGKVRAQLQLSAAATEAQVFAAAEASDRVQAHLAGNTIKKRIYVPGRLVSFVV